MRPKVSAADAALERQHIQRCQKGDSDAFEWLYEKYHRGLYGYLLSLFKSPQAAEDCTQDVFVKLFRQMGSYRFESPFAHWLFRLARNQAFDQMRRNKVRRTESLDAENDEGFSAHERLPGPGDDPERAALKSEKAAVVREAVLELPEAFRVVMVMREWDDLSYEEIAERLDLSEGTVKSRIFRARGLLAKKLKDWV